MGFRIELVILTDQPHPGIQAAATLANDGQVVTLTMQVGQSGDGTEADWQDVENHRLPISELRSLTARLPPSRLACCPTASFGS